MCLACDLHRPLLGCDVHGLVSHVHCAADLQPQTAVGPQGSDRVGEDAFPYCSFGSGLLFPLVLGLALMLRVCLVALLCWLCLESPFRLMEPESGPLLSVGHTCHSNGMRTARNTSQGHVMIRAKSSRLKMLLIPFHFISTKIRSYFLEQNR